MTDHLVVTEQNELKEASIPEQPEQPEWLKVLAYIFSYLFHPLFIPVYITYFLLHEKQNLFAGLSEWESLRYLLQVFVNYTFLPLVSVLLLRALNFIDSIQLKTQKERIAPYMISMIFYFFSWYVFKNRDAPKEIVSMSMAVFNACILGFLANIFIKVSMHTIAMGVLVTFMALLALHDTTNLSLYLSITVLTAGIVSTSRLIVSDHSTKEVYYGFFIGVFSQLAAAFFVG